MGDKNPAAKKKKAAQKVATLDRAKRLAQGNAKNAAKKKANNAK